MVNYSMEEVVRDTEKIIKNCSLDLVLISSNGNSCLERIRNYFDVKGIPYKISKETMHLPNVEDRFYELHLDKMEFRD